MRRLQLGIKRFSDLALCLVVAFVFSPVFLLTALLVRISSPGPIFFVQERVGMYGKIFRLIKFRTMLDKPLEKPPLVWTELEESRITSTGRFLRDYGLDELPQILNIFSGDMSIIGPRPPLPSQATKYTEHQRKAFAMRPGVISLAAVEGRRSIPMEERIELHVRYVESWSLGLDLSILWRSLFVILWKKNVRDNFYLL